jgi:hypothetical protein
MDEARTTKRAQIFSLIAVDHQVTSEKFFLAE